MKKIVAVLLLTWVTAAASQAPPRQQVFSGRISDSMCGASHRMKAAAEHMSDRECLFACINALAKYVLVDNNDQVIPIANQDLGGLPLYAGRPVRITGELKDGAIIATKVEAIPAHLHLGHVMTNWRDTPGNAGFLTIALADSNVAVIHADLAAKNTDLNAMKLHAGHVLNALDPGVEKNGPGSGYGVKKAAAGALQHLEFAASGEGASADLKSNAASVSGLLKEALQATDQAIGLAQKIRSATSLPEAIPLVNELAALTRKISETDLQKAKAVMDLVMKGEGLENAPR